MVKWQPRRFSITDKLEERRDGKIHFARLRSNARRAVSRPLWWTIFLIMVVLIIYFYLRHLG